MRSSQPLPKRVAIELVRLSLPEALPADAVVELVIQVDDVDVNIREFAAYLELLDRSFGRLTTGGLRSYVQRRPDQITVSFRSGSLELILEAIAARDGTITALVVLRFLLKYLPSGLKEVASAYREVEEARFTRARRKQLRQKVDADEELETLDQKDRNELVRYFDNVYVRESRILPAAQRFALRHVRELFFRIRRKE